MEINKKPKILDQKIKLLLKNKKFTDEAFEFLNKYQSKKPTAGEFKKDIDKMLEKYKLPSSFGITVAFLIGTIMNEVPAVYTTAEMIDKCKVIFKNNRLVIEIFGDTTIKDVQKIWSSKVRKEQKKLSGHSCGRQAVIKKLERNLIVWDMTNKKIEKIEILKFLRNTYTKESFVLKDVDRIYADIKKKINLL